MGRPLRIEYPGAFYHITARGNEQKDVFKSQRDREKFLEYLESSTTRYGATIHVYCLMSNHYHLFVETPGGNLSQIMRHINGAYTNYFNAKRKRSGHLFQGRYKAILVEADAYAAELSRYIHLNPVRVGIVSKPEEFQWSSYQSYIGMCPPRGWLKTNFILGYFGKDPKKAGNKYKSFVNDSLGRECASPQERSITAAILGSAEFIAEIEGKYLREKGTDRNLPELRKIIRRLSLDEIMQECRSKFGEGRIMDKAIIYLCHRYSGARLKEIGDRFGVGESAVSQISKRFEQKITNDAEIRKIIQGLKERLRIVNV
ncbi:MAG TPA: transposase [Geobacteraceae bacterium]|nr:transposase [Geobacteraceae bacterium]